MTKWDYLHLPAHRISLSPCRPPPWFASSVLLILHASVCVCMCVRACVREQGKRKAGRSTVVIRCADSWFYVEPRLPGWKSTEMNWRPRYQPLRHMVAPINLSLQTEAHMTTYTPTRASLTYSCAVNIEACLATLWIQAHGQGFISIFRLYSFHKHVS